MVKNMGFQEYKTLAEDTTMGLLQLYVEGLLLEADSFERGAVALKINYVMDNLPVNVKDAVIIELMSSLTRAVKLLREAGIDHDSRENVAEDSDAR